METVKVSDLIKNVRSGINQSRIKNHNELYGIEDFNSDELGIDRKYSQNSCVINLTYPRCSPLSDVSAKKIISLNYLILELDKDKILDWYFSYQFNHSEAIKSQIARYQQGTMTGIRKINKVIVLDLDIKVPSIEKQRQFADLYRKTGELLYYETARLHTITMLTDKLLKKISEED